ncbi:unnamed protein product [Paramecium pentaurelia]|uniref:Uncharacterized protein n=1 Tax=Paramecium pentaurelia TaxID=43138 RepID=A0A8S1S4B7_9CILI|nr:unnamed protein product [Paramecium pentaurelia]
MQYYKSLSSSMTQEQKFGELVKSINNTSNNICDDEQSQKFYSLINQSIQIQYELIQNQEASKLSNLQLLKISNFQFIKCHECYFCIIFNLSNDKLQYRLKNEIMKYSFQTHFFDFTLENVNKFNAELEAFDNYSNQNFRECRIIIFSKDFDQKIIEKVNSFPYIYFCGDPTNVNEIYLENLQLHQIFLTLDFQYKGILQLLPTGLSILNQIIYTNIKINGIFQDINDKIQQIQHPSLKFEKSEDNIFLFYNIPYMNVDEYLYIPLSLSINKIEISDIFQKNEELKYTKDINNEVYDYVNKLKILNQINNQIKFSELEFSIILKDQFFSVDQLMFRNQIKQIKEFQKENEINEGELNEIEKVLEDLCQCNKPYFQKLITFFQMKQSMLYRMKINSFIFQQ